MNKELLKEYAELKTQEKVIADKIKAMQKDVIDETRKIITELGSANLKTDLGTFSLSEKRNYTYSEDYQNKKEEVRIATLPIEEQISEIKEKQIKPLEEQISKEEEVLVALAKEEEESGKATFETVDSLRFTPKKVKEEVAE